MTYKFLSGLIFFIAFFSSGNVIAQNKKLTLEDIYTNGLYRSKGIGQLRWMTVSYTHLSSRAEPGFISIREPNSKETRPPMANTP